MAEPRRAPVLVLAGMLAVVGAMLPSTQGASTARGAALSPPPSAAVVAPSGALSSSWSCGGATDGAASTLPGHLLIDNAGAVAVRASVRFMSQGGYSQVINATVPAQGSTTLADDVQGAVVGSWVAAEATVYGGMASVAQVVVSRWGTTSQPCASTAASTWYFPFGMTLRNAGEYLSLVNPYPADAIADLSFTTERGAESPGAFEGIVVPARGLTVIALSSHLRRRTHIAATVHVRSGGIVAFETELVTTPPKHAQLLGTPGALNPASPRAGLTLTLGQAGAQQSLWWPGGQEGNGTTESYDMYNPGPRTARATLDLLTGTSRGSASGSSGVAGEDQVVLAPHGWAQVTTNGKPWAVTGVPYVAHLVSDNGVPLAAERSVMVMAPSPPAERGLSATIGLAGPARQWMVVGAAPGTVVPVSDPGALPATVIAQQRGEIALGSGQRSTITVPASAAGRALVVSSSAPVLVGWPALAVDQAANKGA